MVACKKIDVNFKFNVAPTTIFWLLEIPIWIPEASTWVPELAIWLSGHLTLLQEPKFGSKSPKLGTKSPKLGFAIKSPKLGSHRTEFGCINLLNGSKSFLVGLKL